MMLNQYSKRNYMSESPPGIKSVLNIEDGEHALVQELEEVVHGVLQVLFPRPEVALQFVVKLGEHVGVLLVQDSVGAAEHVVKVFPTLVEQLVEHLCGRQGQGGGQWGIMDKNVLSIKKLCCPSLTSYPINSLYHEHGELHVKQIRRIRR